jgi:hypothetical protein
MTIGTAPGTQNNIIAHTPNGNFEPVIIFDFWRPNKIRLRSLEDTMYNYVYDIFWLPVANSVLLW